MKTYRNEVIINTGGGTFKAVSNFLQGVVSRQYEIKLIKEKRYVISRIWEPDVVLQNINFLIAKNNPDGMFNVYIRPLDPRFILLDDLTRPFLKPLAEIKPCLLMETSPKNYQAWLKLREIPTETSAQNNIWSTLAAMFQADPSSAKRDQIGRLPGFYNRKPVYFPDYPLVKLHKFEDRFSTWEPSTNIQELPPPVFKKSLPDHKQPKVDRSKVDFYNTCRLLSQKKSDNEITTYLLENSSKAKARGDKYIINTIKNARKKMGLLS